MALKRRREAHTTTIEAQVRDAVLLVRDIDAMLGELPHRERVVSVLMTLRSECDAVICSQVLR